MRIEDVSYNRLDKLLYLQFGLYLATWLAGIYVNGFEPSPSEMGESATSFLLSPAVIVHIVLATLTAGVGAMLFGFGWIHRLKRFTSFTLLSLACVVIAASGGLSFVFGVGNSSADSMVMATCFISAVYLTFLSAPDNWTQPGLKQGTCEIRAPLMISAAMLAIFYLVFTSGMYLNLFVASTVFSGPASEVAGALDRLIISPAALVHEISGAFLLGVALALNAALYRAHYKRLVIRSVLVTSLVAYSMLVGVVMNILPVTNSAFMGSLRLAQASPNYLILQVIAPLLSAAGFVVAIFVTMTVLRSLRRATEG